MFSFLNKLGRNRQKLLLALVLGLIGGSWYFVYRSVFAPPDLNVPLHQSIGIVLADETYREVGHHGKIVLVSIDLVHARSQRAIG